MQNSDKVNFNMILISGMKLAFSKKLKLKGGVLYRACLMILNRRSFRREKVIEQEEIPLSL